MAALGAKGFEVDRRKLQLADAITKAGHICLYNTGEESLYQVKMVAERLGLRNGFVVGQDTLVTDLREVRIVHGHGTGQLRKGIQAFLKDHPLVQKYVAAPDNQGGAGATIVELKD